MIASNIRRRSLRAWTLKLATAGDSMRGYARGGRSGLAAGAG